MPEYIWALIVLSASSEICLEVSLDQHRPADATSVAANKPVKNLATLVPSDQGWYISHR